MLTAAGVSCASFAADRLEGPYAATVRRVVDGDTFEAQVTIWLGQEVQVLVRVRGVDAPESRGDCDSEKLRAAEATAALRGLVGLGDVTLTAIEGDKYFGRIIAQVATPAGVDLGSALLAGGYARAYDGESRQGWCEIGAAEGTGDQVRAALAD